jgi:MFS family permease
MKALAKNRNFFDSNAQRLFLGQLISQICDKVMSMGLIWVITTEFSPRWVPWFVGLAALPHLLLSRVSPKVIARWGVLTTVLASDLFRAILFLAAGMALSTNLTQPSILELLLLSALLSNIAGSLFNPAILSFPVFMASGEKRKRLTAMIDSCFSMGSVAGPIVSVLVYASVGLKGLLIVNGLGYLASFTLASGIRLSNPQPESDHSSPAPPESVEKEVSVLKRQPLVRSMLLSFLLMNFFLAPVLVFLPWYAQNVLGDGISGLARLEVCMGIGTLCGSAFLSVKSLPGKIWQQIATALGLMSLSYLFFTLSTHLWLSCMAVALLGFFLSLANIVILGLFQNHPAPQDVPSVMGLVNLISVASLPISMGITGSVIEKVNVLSFAPFCATVLIAIAASIGFIPGIREV